MPIQPHGLLILSFIGDQARIRSCTLLSSCPRNGTARHGREGRVCALVPPVFCFASFAFKADYFVRFRAAEIIEPAFEAPNPLSFPRCRLHVLHRGHDIAYVVAPNIRGSVCVSNRSERVMRLFRRKDSRGVLA